MTQTWRLGHRPALDGLRGVAIALVVACHVLANAVPELAHALGSAGVSMFFALSGFLITSLLIEERAATGRVAFGRFYWNRALRLLPALVVFVAVVGVFQWLLGMSGWSVAWVLLYVGNFVRAAGGDLGLMGHAWSLALEEQFYLAWPLLLAAVARWRRAAVLVCVVGILASVALRFGLWASGAPWERIYFAPDTQVAGLLLGCLLAAVVHQGSLRVIPGWMATVAVVVAVAAAVATRDAAELIPVVVPALTAAAIWAACQSDAPAWLRGRVWTYLGRRSYGLYLWHYPISVVTYWATGSVIAVAVSMLAAVGVAEWSWRFVEAPFLALKRRSLVPAHPTPSPWCRVEAGR